MAEKVLKCPLCSKKFESVSKLEEHLVKVHPDGR